MAAPATVEEFVDLIRKSNVLDDARLNAYVEKVKAEPAARDLSAFAGMFVRDGLLTYFQAEQFLQGRWKRFTIGKYKVLERLGSGGMGQVFLCEHKLMRRKVAVKVLPTAKAQDPSSLERFYREARAVAALDHVNIVHAYDIDQDDNLHFLVMEYVDGASLQEIIRKTGPMDPNRACHYMYWSAVGLQHAHDNGLIHRDIKPGNILVDRLGVVKILDLGLARFFNDDQDALTRKYDENVLGTADYLAPEQAIDSHTVDGRADIYSLGATFYFLLTGQPPFAEGTVAQKLLWHQTRPPKSIREVRPEVPANVAAIVEKMMGKKPEDRFQTPAELADALLPFTQTPIPAPPDEEMPQLSVAAMGTGGSPSSMVAIGAKTMAPRTPSAGPRTPSPSGGSDQYRNKPTEVVSAAPEAETRRTAAAPTVEPIPDSGQGTSGLPNWEAISADTANASNADTDRRRRDGKSSRRLKKEIAEEQATAKAEAETTRKPPTTKTKPAAKRRSPMLLVMVALAALILMGAGGFSAWYFFLRSPQKPVVAQAGEARKLIVTRSPGGAPLHYSSVTQAIGEFKPGDVIVIQDDEWEESLIRSGAKDLHITSAEGKRVVWKPAKDRDDTPILSLVNSDGAKITGFSFQADGRAKTAIRLAGRSSGVTLENLEISGALRAGVDLGDARGDKNRRITINKVRFHSAGKDCVGAIAFSGTPDSVKGGRSSGSDEVVVQNCVFEGPFRDGAILFEGSATNIDIKQCRFWKSPHGVWFRKPAMPNWQVAIVGNTFQGSAFGVRCEDGNGMKQRNNQVRVSQNYFVGGEILQFQGDPANIKVFSGSEANAHKPGTKPSLNNLIPSVEMDAALPENPADASKFLLYDRAHPLSKAANGKPIGAFMPE